MPEEVICERKCKHNHVEHHCHDCFTEEHGCSCCEEKLEGKQDSAEVRNTLIKIILAGAIFVASFFTDGWVNIALLGVAYLIVGTEVIIGAVRDLVTEFSIDEEFLMTIATVGAIAIGETTEAVAVMLFYSIGELLEDIACARSRKSITALLALRPDSVTVKRDGKTSVIPVEEVKAGDIALVVAGERIAADGVIISGETTIDNSALTGESLPVFAGVGDTVYGGGINTSGAIEVEVKRPYNESSSARILELVENAQDKKAKTERFITRFARKYTIAVVALALVIMFVCPIFTGYTDTFLNWFYKGLTLLVVSCPCAFVISVPLSFFAGVGCASRNGILIKGTASIETLAKIKSVAMDKTGTVTKGELTVSDVNGDDEVLRLAAYAESRSTHPIAKAIVRAYGGDIDESAIKSTVEVAGQGIRAEISGQEITVGSDAMIPDFRPDEQNSGGAAVYVSRDGEYIGTIILHDEIKPDSVDAVAGLKSLGVGNIVMLSGDSQEAVEKVAAETGISEVRARLSPEEKCSELSKIKLDGGITAFVGDGINDAPVLAMSDVGVAMGGLGSDAAIETADVVILDDKLSRLPIAVKIARKTMRTVKQCIAFAFGSKLAVIVLELLGYAGMWAAVFADVGVTVICVLNSLRALNYKANKAKS